jgi:hypothetical protein
LLLPAFAPAARAGLRLPFRDGLVSGRASFRTLLPLRGMLLERLFELGLLADLAPLALPLRCPHEGVDAFVLRALALLGRAPLLEPLLACAPFPLWPFPL